MCGTTAQAGGSRPDNRTSWRSYSRQGRSCRQLLSSNSKGAPGSSHQARALWEAAGLGQRADGRLGLALLRCRMACWRQRHWPLHWLPDCGCAAMLRSVCPLLPLHPDPPAAPAAGRDDAGHAPATAASCRAPWGGRCPRGEVQPLVTHPASGRACGVHVREAPFPDCAYRQPARDVADGQEDEARRETTEGQPEFASPSMRLQLIACV